MNQEPNLSHMQKMRVLREILVKGGSHSTQYLTKELGCTRMQLNRLLNKLKDKGYWTDYDKEKKGYVLIESQHPSLDEVPVDKFYLVLQLIKIAKELNLENINPELSSKNLIWEILGKNNIDYENPMSLPVRYLSIINREQSNKILPKLYKAVIQKRQVSISYRDGKNNLTRRSISVQQILNYRNNWYIDAYCHERNDWRIFAVDRIETIRQIQRYYSAPKLTSSDIAKRESAFGLFSGKANQIAVLHFAPEVAHWVKHEQWHPEQKDKKLTNGGLERRIPYYIDTELQSEILRFGEQIQVVEPRNLRESIINRLRLAINKY